MAKKKGEEEVKQKEKNETEATEELKLSNKMRWIERKIYYC